MDPDENDTPDSGTEDVTPASDTAETFDWYDPDDEPDTAPVEEVAATDEGIEVEPEEEEPSAPALVTLPDGTQAPLEEVTKGYLRQADYTRKTEQLAQKRQAVEADVQRIDSTIQAFVDHLTELVPEPPKSPPAYSLAVTNPQEYTRQKAMYDAQLNAHQQAVAKIAELVKLGEQPKAMRSALDKDADANLVAEEGRKLAERFPAIATQDGRQKFMTGAAEAAEAVGYSLKDLGDVRDHRLLALAHWAGVGMKAQKAREAARAKTANVPPVAPRKPGQPVQAGRNVDAMRKLSRSGSIKHAVMVDWD